MLQLPTDLPSTLVNTTARTKEWLVDSNVKMSNLLNKKSGGTSDTKERHRSRSPIPSIGEVLSKAGKKGKLRRISPDIKPIQAPCVKQIGFKAFKQLGWQNEIQNKTQNINNEMKTEKITSNQIQLYVFLIAKKIYKKN